MGCVNSAEDDNEVMVPSNRSYYLTSSPMSPASPATSSSSSRKNKNDEESAHLNNNNKKTSKAEQQKLKTEEILGPAVPVYLNVYNLQQLDPGKKKSFNGHIGFGIYHSGVQILNYEFSFGGAPGAPANTPGIFATPPRACLPADQFHEQIHMGNIYGGLTLNEVQAILIKMQPDWMAASYHLLARNCNHFAEAFLKELSTQFHVEPKMKPPAYINRAARWGDVVIPDRVYKYLMEQVPQAPPDQQQEGGSSSTTGAAASASSPTSTSSAAAGGSGAGYIPFTSTTSNTRHQRATAADFETEDDILAAIPIPTREEMNIMNIREIKTVMWVHGISWEGCIEKEDIIKRVEEFQNRNQMSSTQRSFMANAENNNNTTNSSSSSRAQQQQDDFHDVVMNGVVLGGSEAEATSPNRNRVVTGGRVVNVNENNNSNNNTTRPVAEDSSTFINPNPAAVQSIMDMGFPDKGKVEDALRKSRNNVDRAVDLLLNS